MNLVYFIICALRVNYVSCIYSISGGLIKQCISA